MTFAVDWPLNVKHLSILNMHDGNVNGVRPLGRPRYQFKIGGLTLSELDNIVQVLKYKSRGIIGFKESDLARMRTQETLREKKTIKRGRAERVRGRERETQTQRHRDRDRETEKEKQRETETERQRQTDRQIEGEAGWGWRQSRRNRDIGEGRRVVRKPLT